MKSKATLNCTTEYFAGSERGRSAADKSGHAAVDKIGSSAGSKTGSSAGSEKGRAAADKSGHAAVGKTGSSVGSKTGSSASSKTGSSAKGETGISAGSKTGLSRKRPEIVAILATWATAVMAAGGLMWTVLWLLTGNWKPEFSWNGAGFLNRVLEEKTLREPIIYRPFEDDGQVSWLFLAGVFLIFAILVTVLARLIYAGHGRGKATAERFWCWLGCLLVVVILAAIGGGGNFAENVENQVAGWHESIESKLEDRKYGAEGDPMTLGDFARLDGLEAKEEEALQVIMSDPQCCYLKGYVGEIYEADGWKPLAGKDLAKENGLFVQLYDEGFYNQATLGTAVSLTRQGAGAGVDTGAGADPNKTTDGNILAGAGAPGQTNQITVKNTGTDSRYMYVPYEMISAEVEAEKLIGGSVLKAAKNKANLEYTLTAADYAEDKISETKALLKELQKAEASENAADGDSADDGRGIGNGSTVDEDTVDESTIDEFFIKEYNYRQFAGRKYLQITEAARQALKGLLGDETGQVTTTQGTADQVTSAQMTTTQGTAGQVAPTQMTPTQVKKKILQSLEDFKYEKNTAYRAEQGDFLTVFFEAKEGYSVHFATAAVLMFRYYGIPARFAEGYLVTPEDAKAADGGEPIHIEKTNYHAWAEYYEDGIGWVPFEATPAYMGIMPGDVSVVWQSESGESQQQMQAENKPADNKVNNLITEEAEVNLWAAAKVALLILLICVLIGAAIWRLTHRRFGGFSRKDFKSTDCRRAIMAMMAYMRKLGIDPAVISEEAAVISEEAAVISEEVMVISEEAAKIYEAAAMLYDEARYSNHHMTEAQKELMAQYMSQAIKVKKGEKGLLRAKKAINAKERKRR